MEKLSGSKKLIKKQNGASQSPNISLEFMILTIIIVTLLHSNPRQVVVGIV